MRIVMRSVLASVVALLALPAALPRSRVAARLRSARPPRSRAGRPLTFAVRTAAPDGSVVVRVSGHDEVDDDGLLTGPEGTWLDETATQALDGPRRSGACPPHSVLRQRPGHYYWQAYVTGERTTEPIGPSRS